MLRRIFQSKQSFWDVQESFSPQNFRFFESVILGWKEQTLQAWGVNCLKESFKKEMLREEVRRRSSVFNSVLSYFKSGASDLEDSRVPVLEGHFKEFDELFKEEQNRLFHAGDFALKLKVGCVTVTISDGDEALVLNVHSPSLTAQVNECFENYEFSVQSLDGAEVSPERSGSI